LVEQLTFNQLVAGSNPARPTNLNSTQVDCTPTAIRKVVRSIQEGPLAQLVEQLTFNQLVAGSNPARPTTFKWNTSKSKNSGKSAFWRFFRI
jgi:hypothetical protein